MQRGWMSCVALMSVASVALMAVACAPDEPCSRYVDYMCSCHGDDTGFDCAELERTYEQADPEVQNSCALELSNQRDEDEAAGKECETS